jgi:hypothetical protein
MPLGTWFEQHFTNQVNWSEVAPNDPAYRRHAKAEELAYRAAFEVHELPFTPLLMHLFTLDELYRIIPPKDQYEIWLEIIAVFSDD